MPETTTAHDGQEVQLQGKSFLAPEILHCIMLTVDRIFGVLELDHLWMDFYKEAKRDFPEDKIISLPNFKSLLWNMKVLACNNEIEVKKN